MYVLSVNPTALFRNIEQGLLVQYQNKCRYSEEVNGLDEHTFMEKEA
jgi:hypothetical protein